VYVGDPSVSGSSLALSGIIRARFALSPGSQVLICADDTSYLRMRGDTERL
jgi:hypothetical protein